MNELRTKTAVPSKVKFNYNNSEETQNSLEKKESNITVTTGKTRQTSCLANNLWITLPAGPLPAPITSTSGFSVKADKNCSTSLSLPFSESAS